MNKPGRTQFKTFNSFRLPEEKRTQLKKPTKVIVDGKDEIPVMDAKQIEEANEEAYEIYKQYVF